MKDTEVVNISTARPANIEIGKTELRYPEEQLMKLMIHHIKQSKPLTKPDITELWLYLYRERSEMWYERNVYEDRKFVRRERIYYKVDKFNSGAQLDAMTWFKRTLANCIIKGKMLAIPVIQID